MYTYDQAQDACKEHKYLIGSQLRRGWRIIGTIEGVVVAPLDGINQYKFLKEYKSTGNAGKSLKFYKGVLHTVLLVVRSQQCSTEVFTLNLETYMEQHHAELIRQNGKVLALEY
jgi:hypothetical protein